MNETKEKTIKAIEVSMRISSSEATRIVDAVAPMSTAKIVISPKELIGYNPCEGSQPSRRGRNIREDKSKKTRYS